MKKGSTLYAELLFLRESIVDNCPECKGVGYYIAEETGEDRPCECMLVYLYIKDLRIANIPKEYWHLNWTQLSIKPVYKRILKEYFKYFDNAVTKGLGLLFLGINGVGKTSMMCEIGKQAIIRGYRPLYLTNETYITSLQSNKAELQERIESADVILLDELEKAYIKEGSDYVPKKTEEFIRRLLTEQKILIISTNEEAKSLVNIFGESTLSMLKRKLKFVHVDGADYSPTKQSTWVESLKTEYSFSHKNILKAARKKYIHEHNSGS